MSGVYNVVVVTSGGIINTTITLRVKIGTQGLRISIFLKRSFNIKIKMDGLIEIPPEQDPENMPSATEELLQIMEDFADYIDKFMFEIVTFLAVLDSAMGLIKDVLGLFGFEGWKMAFFPTFSFIVTTGVFLFGAKKRKGKRESDVPEGLAEAFDAFEDVIEVVEDVAEEMEDIEKEDGANEDELSNVLGDVVGSNVTPQIGSVTEEMQGTEEGNGGDENISNTPADANQNIARKVIAVAVLAFGIMAKLKKKRGRGQEAKHTPADEGIERGEGSSRDVEKQKARIGLETPQGSSQENEWQSSKKASGMTGASSSNAYNRTSLALTTCGNNESVIIDLNLPEQGKTFDETDWQNAAKDSVISTERHLRWHSRQLVREVAQGASQIKRGIEGVPLEGISIRTAERSQGTSPFDEDIQTSETHLLTSPLDMATGMVKNTTEMAGSAVQSVDQQARKGVEETRKKSGSILHIAIRLVRLIVRVVNKKKGGSSEGSQKNEDSTEKGASSDIRGSRISLESDSVYFDCASTLTPKQTQRLESVYTSCKSLQSTGTQTDRENWQPRYRSEPQFLHHASMGIFADNPIKSPWENLRRSVISMPDTELIEIRDAADEEMRLRVKPGEQLRMVADAMTLRPAWLGSRDEVASRLTKQVRRETETLLDVASPHLRPHKFVPRNGEYTTIPFSHHLDAPVILHQAKDTGEANPKPGIQACSTGREADRIAPYSQGPGAESSVAGAEGNAKPGSSSQDTSTGSDRVQSLCVSDVHRNSINKRDKVPGTPDDWFNKGKEPDLDDGSYVKAGGSDRGERNWSKHPKERNIRSSSSYEGLEEYEDRIHREQHFSVRSPKRRDLSGTQCSVDYKPRNLRRSVSYEQTEDDLLVEEEPYQRRERRSASSSNSHLKTIHEKQSRDTSPLKSPNRSLHKRLEVDAEEAVHYATPSPILPSESSESVESLRNQRRSNMSLSSVRFADEEPRAVVKNFRISRGRDNREKNRQNDMTQSQNGLRNSRRKITANGRWNSAVCLTGDQNTKMSLSSREHYGMNDDYIYDEIGSPRYRQGSRNRVSRAPSLKRLPSTISRTRSTNYLGDDESDDRAR